MLVSSKNIFQKCDGKFEIAAVNVWDMEMILGLFSTAQKANAPFIIQTTPDQFDPIIPGKMYMNEFEKFILQKFELLKSVGKTNTIK
jgi:fructose/tagatose bisphosphate aldolase